MRFRLFPYIVALLLACASSSSTSAQTWNDLNEQVMRYYQAGDLQRAEEVCQQLVTLSRRDTGITYLDHYSTSLTNLATIHKARKETVKAIPLLIEATELIGQALGRETMQYAAALNKLAGAYMELEDYGQAEQTYLRIGHIVKELYGESHAEYATVLYNLGGVYYSRKDYDKGKTYYESALDIRREQLGAGHPRYAAVLYDLGRTWDALGETDRALDRYLSAMTIYRSAGSSYASELARCLIRMGDAQELLARFTLADSLFSELAKLQLERSGENSPDYAEAIERKAGLYRRMARYAEAEPLYRQALQIRGQESTINRRYLFTLSGLASLCLEQGRYEAALRHFTEVRDKWEGLDKTNPEYISSLGNLAMVYHKLGRYDRAEPLFEKSLQLRLSLTGDDHPEYAVALNNMAVIYQELGQYTRALPLFEKAKDILESAGPDKELPYASCINNLAQTLQAIRQTGRAEALLKECLELRYQRLGEAHPDYGVSLNNLANLYLETGRYPEAEPLYLQARDILERQHGKMHPDYANSLANLAELYKLTGRYKDAERSLTLAAEIYNQLYGSGHPLYATCLNNLALLYEQSGAWEKTARLLPLNSRIVMRHLSETFSTLAEREKAEMLDNGVSLLDINNSFLFKYPQAAKDIAANNFSLLLRFKSMLLAQSKDLARAARHSNDTTVVRLYEAWMEQKRTLARYYSGKEQQQYVDKLEGSAQQLEKELNRRLANSQALAQNTIPDINALRQQLRDDQAVVEYVRFDYYDRRWTDSVYYAAYLLRKQDSVPLFIPLFEERKLDSLLNKAGGSTKARVSFLYRQPAPEDAAKQTPGKELYNLLWAPLEPYLKGIRTIAYAPAGRLYSVAFHALPVGGQLLLDKYVLQQYTSTRDFVLQLDSLKDTAPSSITLFGDPFYDANSLLPSPQRGPEQEIKRINQPLYTPPLQGQEWSRLPGTARELETIQHLFQENRFSARSFTGVKASEEQFKSVDGRSPGVLHLATHGFFLPGAEKRRKVTGTSNRYSLADDPLLRSGLVLAGANYAWGGRVPPDGVEDGVVTAYEISQLNLEQTGLVVLSACESGLGDIKGGEGVFGLQRAFKLAGVSKMIVSLWQVPDKETTELMTAFYTNWLSGKTIESAFHEAQQELRKKYAPYFWAAFVLVE